ncbi:MAG: GNAT family N-acetyltransferase [Planctomycetota bacterium]|jgi:GNAT superfamily N-acetyltransferase
MTNETRQLRVRRYEPQDHDAVVALHNLALKDAGAYIADSPWDADLDAIGAEYLDSGGEFVVGEIDREIVAMGGLQRVDEHTAKIRRMRIQPGLQRRGYGKIILERLESSAVELGYRKIVLDTSYLLTGALNFYPRFGYQKTHEEDLGNDRIVFFEKDLP